MLSCSVMAYVHKKFLKKYTATATAQQQNEDDKPSADTSAPTAASARVGAGGDGTPPGGGVDTTLKHGIGSIVGGAAAAAAAKEPLHRQYYCDVCRIAFRVKSNLEKHTQKRWEDLGGILGFLGAKGPL